MNLSAVSSIKFSGENLQAQNNLTQQKQQTVDVIQSEQKSSSKFSGTDKLQLIKDKFEKLTPEDTNKLFIASGLTSILSGVMSYTSKSRGLLKAVSSFVGAVGFVGFAVASARTIMNAKNKETLKPATDEVQGEQKISKESMDSSVKTVEVTDIKEQPKVVDADETKDVDPQSVVVDGQEQSVVENTNQEMTVPTSTVPNELFSDFQK